MKPENPEAAKAMQQEWRKTTLDWYRNQHNAFVGQIKGFLADGAAMTPEALKKGIEAELFLSDNDEQGPVSENNALYEAKSNTTLRDSDIANIYERDEKLANVYRRISGRTNFMRNRHGDMSKTVPHSIKREMIAAQVEQLKKFAELHRDVAYRENKKDDPEGKIAALENENRSLFNPISKKADPYILADMTVAINHADEYKKLRREFLRVGGVGDDKMNLLGEWASLKVARLLCDIHSEEYAREQQAYLADDTRDMDKQKRNSLVRSGSAIDDEFSGRSAK